MNFEYLLYQYLLKHNKAEVPDFGVFELTKESAKIDAENSIIIPPKETVTFQYNAAVYNNELAKSIAEESKSNLFIVQTELKTEVARWFQILQTEKLLNLGNLGQYQLNESNKVIKIIDHNDVFGLEEINLQNLKNRKPSKKAITEDYRFNKNVIWTFLVLIIIGSTVLFLFGDQELIFGKFSQIPTKKVVKKIEKPKVLEQPKSDTIKIDSTKQLPNAKIQKTNR